MKSVPSYAGHKLSKNSLYTAVRLHSVSIISVVGSLPLRLHNTEFALPAASAAGCQGAE